MGLLVWSLLALLSLPPFLSPFPHLYSHTLFLFPSLPPLPSTELYLVQDSSVDFQDTWDFLRRRMEDATNFAKSSQQVRGSALDPLPAPLRTLL